MAGSGGLRGERVKASRQYRDGAFRNTSGLGPRMQGSSLPVIGEFFFGGKNRVPRGQLPVESPLEAWARPASSGFRVTWLGHSTLLLELDGFRVLTDPVFGDRASPFSFAGPKRFHAVPASIGQLPPLNAVLLSHNHFDHLCAASMREIAKLHVPVITSLGVGAELERLGVDPAVVTELDWWESHTLPGGGLTFTAAPAQHFSGRGMLDRNTTLWSSWSIATANRKVFFSGDTGLTDEFVDIGKRLGPFDVTMLEVGAWHPAWGTIHLGPENALRAFEMLGGGTLLPVHWGTFDLALHAWDEPAETLFGLAQQKGARLLTPLLGRPFEPAHVEAPNPWWRAVSANASRERSVARSQSGALKSVTGPSVARRSSQ